MTSRGFHRSIRRGILAAAVVAGGAWASSTHASTVSQTYTGTGSGSDGTVTANMSASVTFTLDTTAHTLKIALTNTIGSVVPSNTFLLTGVFWNSSSTIGGSFTSIGLGGVGTGPGGTGSVVNPTGGDTGYFGYGTNTGGPGGRKYGAFSSGYANWDTMLIGPNGTNGESPKSPDGPAGGLISDAGLSGSNVNKPAIEDTAVWTITGVNSNFSLSAISSVWFQYGTDLGEPGFGGTPNSGGGPGTPLPAALWSGLSLMSGLGVFAKIRRSRRSQP